MKKLTTEAAREHLLARLNRSGECWIWTGAKSGDYGLVQYTVLVGYPIRAHRAAYLLLVGPIPEGRHIHHLCKTPSCCNPEHLTAITPSQHAQLHHPKSEAPCRRNHAPNWRRDKQDRRACRECDRERNLANRRALSATPV